MGTPELPAHEDELGPARAFFDEIFPEAVLIIPASLPDSHAGRMRVAGFGIAEVILPDGSLQHATYVTTRTPVVAAIEQIWDREQFGELPIGSHEQAMDSVINGEFSHEWGAFLPRQTD